jgi:hypothetical protein
LVQTLPIVDGFDVDAFFFIELLKFLGFVPNGRVLRKFFDFFEAFFFYLNIKDTSKVLASLWKVLSAAF